MDDEDARSNSSSEFSAQARELIDALFSDLRLLRAAQTGRARRAILDRAFRHAHTLKVTLTNIARSEASGRLVHALEDVLEAARSGRRALDDAALDACEDAADTLSEALDAIARGEDAEPAAFDVRAALLLRRLAAAVETPPVREFGEEFPAGAHARVFASLPEEIAVQLNAFERRRLSAVADEGARVVSVKVAFDLESLDEGFRRFGDALAETGEIVATLAGAAGDADGDARQISFRLVCATHATAAELTHRLAEFGARVELIFDAAAETGAGVAASPPPSVRVPLAELDDLAFDVSALFDDTTAALASARSLASRGGGGDGGAAEIDEAAVRLRESFLSLEERVLVLRMRELAPALERAARAGRQAARAAGKRVEFETAGGEARIDRALAERIAGPLAHLLRNAVDHGIEPADERRAAGKSEAGRVRVEAATEGARVRLVVEDDGRGIDAALVERAARSRGIVAEGASLEEGQALRLIFRPGFSTAATVTETSGRGVGLDAVEREVEAAGGEVRVRTRAGRGTTFELHLPLALALAAVLLVESDGQTYALEAGRVVETLRADESAAVSEGARRFAPWRGQLLPLVSLRELLGRLRGAAHASERTHVVVHAAGLGANSRASVEAGNGEAVGEAARGGAGGEVTASVGRAFVVAVDGVVGRRDALVRGLGRHATRWRGVGGAVDLRDGTAALLLDLARLSEGRGGVK